MRQNVTRGLLWAIGLGSLIVLSACQVNVVRSTETRTITEPHLVGSGIVVESRNGAIEVVADSMLSEVEIEVRLTAGGATRAEADRRLAGSTILVERRADRTLVLSPQMADGWRNGDGAAFSIRLPDATGVSLTSSNGALTARGLAGELIARSSNGRVNVHDHDGPADLRTSNGRITVENLGGALTANTSNGRVIARSVDGPTDITTSNGRVTVVLSDDQPGPVSVRSSNGSVAVTIGSAFTGVIDARTSNGSVSVQDTLGRITQSNMQRRSGTVHVGDDTSQTSIIRTSNGSVTITIDTVDIAQMDADDA
jgi:hypothetical protein